MNAPFVRMPAVAILIAVLAACARQEAAGTPEPSSATPATTTADQPSGPAYVSPANLADCTRGSVVTLTWDFRTSQPAVGEVEVFTGGPGHETLFAAGGPNGQAPTGAWAYPGTVFILKDKVDGRELERVTVAGPACPAT
jgi:hypothetical protein